MADNERSTLYRSFKYRLYPNQQQKISLNALLAHLCDLYNACLQQRHEAYRRRRVVLTKYDQCRELTILRQEMPSPWSQRAQRGAINRVDRGFQRFFRKLQAGEKAGLPRFRSLHSYDTIEHDEPNGWSIAKKHKLTVKGVGAIRVKWHRPLPSKPRTCSITRRGNTWLVVFQCRVDAQPLPPTGRKCGIDFGLTTLITLDDGTAIANPRFGQRAMAKDRRLYRAVARKKLGSQRRLKARQRLGKHIGHVVNQRRNFNHTLARRLVNEHDMLALEIINLRPMFGWHLGRSLYDAAWSMIKRFVVEKAESAARIVVLVDSRRTSKLCSGCGALDQKTLDVRIHSCGECGLVMCRNQNAARNILRAGEALLAQSTVSGPRLVREAA